MKWVNTEYVHSNIQQINLVFLNQTCSMDFPAVEITNAVNFFSFQRFSYIFRVFEKIYHENFYNIFKALLSNVVKFWSIVWINLKGKLRLMFPLQTAVLLIISIAAKHIWFLSLDSIWYSFKLVVGVERMHLHGWFS